MIQFILNYVDKCNIQSLEITIVNQYQFNNDIYSISESESKEIYLLLTSDDKKEINNYLLELIQFDDIENLSKLAQRGEI
jgi:hypothetical protein